MITNLNFNLKKLEWVTNIISLLNLLSRCSELPTIEKIWQKTELECQKIEQKNQI